MVSKRPSQSEPEAGMEKLGNFRRLGAMSLFQFRTNGEIPSAFSFDRLLHYARKPSQTLALPHHLFR